MHIFWTDSTGLTQEIYFDASVKEDHKATAEITKHPLESGASVSDHVVAGPEMLTVEARVSNTPIRQPLSNMRGVVSSVQPIDLGDFAKRTMAKGATGSQAAQYEKTQARLAANVLQFSGPFDRVGDIHRELLRLRKVGQPVTAVTSLRQYENMLIFEVSAPRDVENGNAVTFNVSMEQVSFADSQTVDVPEPMEPRGSAAGNRGHQNPTDTAAPAGSRSFLAQGHDYLRTLLHREP